MKTILNTLFVFTRGAYLRLDGDTVVVMIDREKRHQVPLHHLEALALFGEVSVSPSLIHYCATGGKAVIFFSHHGEFKARVEGPVSGNVHLRLDQYKASGTDALAIDMAKAFVAGKVRNARQVLLRTARDTREPDEREELREVAARIKINLGLLGNAKTLDEVRGYEGDAAKRYFQTMPLHIRYDVRQDFPFNGRSKRPPRDAMNAIISFLYTLLMNDCRSALEAVGLDPQVGFLHQLRPGRAALALDLCEEFRSIVCDRLAFTLINRQQIKAGDFEHRDGGAVYLTEGGRKAVVAAYQVRKQEEVNHPFLKAPVPVGLIPYIQARILARTIRGDLESYIPFLQK
jgi:CRISP-associated protein Cas1